MSGEPILLLTHSGDFFTIDRVEEALRARGVSALRVNTDRFPAEHRLSARFSGAQHELTLETAEGAIRLDRVKAIWSRRLWPGDVPKEVDPRFSGHCRTESRSAYFGVLGLLDQAFWMNRPDRTLAAEQKLTQLRLAGELGLALPPTLLTNDPKQVAPFWHEQGGKVITKLLGALSQTMDASGDFMYTSVVAEHDLQALGGLRLAPQLFQPLVEKKRELRVIAVGEKLFVGALGAAKNPNVQVDWRRATGADGLQWTAEELPGDVAQKVHALMARLGLVYGALDFLVDRDDRYVFLEINPAGEWGWLERDLHFPIAQTIADTLIEGVKP